MAFQSPENGFYWFYSISILWQFLFYKAIPFFHLRNLETLCAESILENLKFF